MSDPKWVDRGLYELYQYMLKRCYRSTNPGFHRYGGRGIKVCDRWLPQKPRGQGFRNFKADIGPRPKGYSLDRRNNDGDYTPQNCHWIPWADQHKNRHNNVWIEFMGVRLIAADWAKETGVRADVITKRIAKGWPLEASLFHTGSRLRIDYPAHRVEAAAAKKRAQTHCKRGHPYENDHICRICKRDWMRAHRG